MSKDFWQVTDRWLVERVFEPAAWRVAQWAGVTSTVIARALLGVWTAGALAYAWHTLHVWHCIMAGLCVAITPVRLWTLTQIERATERSRGANPEKHRPFMVYFRFLLCAMFVGAAAGVATVADVSALDVGNASYLLHLYVSACDRPPPEIETKFATASAS